MVQAQDFLSWFNPLPGQGATPAQISEARTWAEALQKPSAPGQSGAYQSYGKWNAMADALRGALGGYTMGQAARAERGNINSGAAALPNLGDYGPAQPGAAPAAGAPGQSATNPATGASITSLMSGDGAGLQSGLAGDTASYLKSKEGFSASPYADGRQTSIGYGTRAQPGETSITPEQAEARLGAEAGNVSAWIDQNIKVPLSPSQRTALTSFGYNLGTGPGGLQDLAPAINSGNFQAAAAVMPHYNHFQGQPFASLTQRRAEEARMLLQGSQPPRQGVLAGQPSASAGMPDQPTLVHSQTFSPDGQQTGGPGMPQPRQAALQPPSPGPAVNNGNLPGAGAAAMPQPAGMQNIMPPLPTDAQIHSLMTNPNPEYRQLGMQFYEQKQKALQPQIMTTPTGHQIAFSPYRGSQDIGIPGKPMIEKFQTEVPGVWKGEQPAQYAIDQHGTPYLQKIPIAPSTQAGQQPGAPGAPAPSPAPAGGFSPTSIGATPAAAQPGLNVGPAGQPLQNSQLFGEQAGPSAAGGMPNLDTASIPELQAWGARRQSEQKGMDVASETTWKSRAELHGAAITALKSIPSEMQQLAILEDAYKQPHVQGGPLAEYWETGRAVIREVYGNKAADEVPPSQIIDKTNTALSFKAAGELTSRPALMEVMAAMRANPGLKMTDKSSLYLINLMQQQKAQEQQIGMAANEFDNPREFISWRKKFYENNPLVSPFTGEQLKTKADFKADLDRTVEKSEGRGLGGAMFRSTQVGAPAAPAPAPAPARQPGGPVRVDSPQDVAKLPSGTRFMTPDGRVKVAP